MAEHSILRVAFLIHYLVQLVCIQTTCKLQTYCKLQNNCKLQTNRKLQTYCELHTNCKLQTYCELQTNAIYRRIVQGSVRRIAWWSSVEGRLGEVSHVDSSCTITAMKILPHLLCWNSLTMSHNQASPTNDETIELLQQTHRGTRTFHCSDVGFPTPTKELLLGDAPSAAAPVVGRMRFKRDFIRISVETLEWNESSGKRVQKFIMTTVSTLIIR